MQSRKKMPKRSASKNQEKLMKDSLRKFLGHGLLQDSAKPNEVRSLFIKDALNSLLLK